LDQVAKLIDELDRQIQSLTKQAKQAERYRELSSEIRMLDRALLRARYLGLSNRNIQVEQALTDCLRELSACELKEREAGTKIGELENKLGQIRDEQQVAAHLVASSQFKLQEHRKNLARRQETEDAIRHEQQQIALNEAELKTEQEVLRAEEERLETALSAHANNKPESDDSMLQRECDALSHQITQLRARMSEIKQAEAVRQHQMNELTKRASQLRDELPKLEMQSARAEESLTRAKTRLEQAEEQNQLQTSLNDLISCR
jgi:chromosome segregation protein